MINILQKNFKKQKLNPISTIISNLDLALEAFDEEKELDDSIHLTEDQLRQIVKNILPKVEKYFIDVITFKEFVTNLSVFHFP